jgi:hypothetical protein
VIVTREQPVACHKRGGLNGRIPYAGSTFHYLAEAERVRTQFLSILHLK